MNLADRLSQLVRDAVEPMLNERLNDLEERLLERLRAVVQQPPADTAPPLLTQDDLACYLRVAPRTVKRMVAAGELPPPIPISAGRSRWRRSDIDEWLDRREAS